MATATMATAAGAAALLYYTLKRSFENNINTSQEGQSSATTESRVRLGLARSAPSTWFEAIATISETLRFTYAETLGKWPIVDLAFGINFLMKRQGQSQVVSAFAGEGSEELRGPGVLVELKELLVLITACIHFSKKPFPQFLEATGYSQDCVLLQEPKAGLLKPAFTILVDAKLQSIFLFVRGTHSVKDTLTAVTGAVVPFHHTVLDESGVSNIVLGYAHCGMVAAARWISQLATPVLLRAQSDYPSYKLKIVGHSLGGGTAALLTYILRERKDFASLSCVCFAPAACMTWELAESGKPFATSVIHGSDLVPTFSAASVDDLRNEVTASAWIDDFREQIERVRFLKAFLRSTVALSNRISSIARASRPLYPYLEDAAKAGAKALRPVSSGTQIVMRRAQTVVQAVVRTRPPLGLGAWSCMGARRRTVGPCALTDTGSELEVEDTVLEKEELIPMSRWSDGEDRHDSRGGNAECLSDDGMDIDRQESGSSDNDGGDDDDELPVRQDDQGTSGLTESELLQRLQQELDRQREVSVAEWQEEEEVARKLTQEEEEQVAATATEVGSSGRRFVIEGRVQGRELNRFFPPGRIIHLLAFDAESVREGGEPSTVSSASTSGELCTRVGMYLTDRSLYGKVRLSRTMINDHYMPSYRRTMETLLKDLESEVH